MARPPSGAGTSLPGAAFYYQPARPGAGSAGGICRSSSAGRPFVVGQCSSTLLASTVSRIR